jgi:hypothetical protein
MMLNGNHDAADLRDEASASPDGWHDISERLARLDALEKELGDFVREIFREANSTR